MSVYRKRPIFMSHFPPDEIVTVLKSNANFAVADCCNDVSDMAMFELDGSLLSGQSSHASAGGTTGIGTGVAIPFELPRTWDEWITHYSNYAVLSTRYEVEIQMAASDATGNVWICWWQTAIAGRDIPCAGTNLADGTFDTDDLNFTGAKQASQIIMAARGIHKVRTYRADALGGRRMIRVNLNHFRGNNGEWAEAYNDSGSNGNGATFTVQPVTNETVNMGVSPKIHFAIIHQDFTHAPMAAEIFIRKFQKIHFLDRVTNPAVQVPT